MPATEKRSHSNTSLESRAVAFAASMTSATKVPDARRVGLVEGSVTTSRTIAPPVRGVVLPAGFGRYDGLVEDGRYIVGGLLPVEPGNAPGQGCQQGHSSHLGGPREKVRLHDPLKTGLASKVAAKKQVRRIILRQARDIAAEGSLDHHADDGAQVGVSDEQVVQLIPRPSDLTQSCREQVLPQLSLDPDGAGIAVPDVERLEGRYVPLSHRTALRPNGPIV